jgi:hypothetical protein
MGVMTQTSFSKALFPGVNKWYGEEYDRYPEEFSKIFEKSTSKRAYEEDVGISGLGLASVKEQGGNISYDEASQAFVTRYAHVVYGLGFIITREMYEDDLYNIMGQKLARMLARSMRETKEQVAHSILNRAFNSSYTGGDGVELCSLLHPNFAGGTWANEPSTDVDISEAALEQAIIDISKWEDDRGLPAMVRPKSLHIPVDLMFDVHRILQSPYRVGTADNDANALGDMGYFNGGVFKHIHLTDTDAWFIKTDAPDGFKYFERRAMSFGTDDDFDTENAKYKATERYSFGWTDPRCVYGSQGA